jgi:DNA-directed RNA polymerase sigma subunit (sigma70/sigma32)
MGLLPHSRVTGDGVELVDAGLDPEQALIERETAAANAELLASVDLPPRWRIVLERRLAGHANDAIARDFGVSTMRTSEILYAAIARIRKARR